MIYSKKYGRRFKNSGELQRYTWWDYRTKPILPWFGLRDCLYSDEYRKERGLKTSTGETKAATPLLAFAGILNLLISTFLLSEGAWGGGLFCAAVGIVALALWRKT